jgi:hypothetical protein
MYSGGLRHTSVLAATFCKKLSPKLLPIPVRRYPVPFITQQQTSNSKSFPDNIVYLFCIFPSNVHPWVYLLLLVINSCVWVNKSSCWAERVGCPQAGFEPGAAVQQPGALTTELRRTLLSYAAPNCIRCTVWLLTAVLWIRNFLVWIRTRHRKSSGTGPYQYPYLFRKVV